MRENNRKKKDSKRSTSSAGRNEFSEEVTWHTDRERVAASVPVTTPAASHSRGRNLVVDDGDSKPSAGTRRPDEVPCADVGDLEQGDNIPTNQEPGVTSSSQTVAVAASSPMKCDGQMSPGAVRVPGPGRDQEQETLRGTSFQDGESTTTMPPVLDARLVENDDRTQILDEVRQLRERVARIENAPQGEVVASDGGTNSYRCQSWSAKHKRLGIVVILVLVVAVVLGIVLGQKSDGQTFSFVTPTPSEETSSTSASTPEATSSPTQGLTPSPGPTPPPTPGPTPPPTPGPTPPPTPGVTPPPTPGPIPPCDDSDTNNLANGEESGGTARVVARGTNGTSSAYQATLGSMCSQSWTAFGTLCDEPPTTHCRLVSTKTNANSGATFRNPSPYSPDNYGALVIDLGATAVIREASIFQMFSDGKTTHVEIYSHPNNINEPDIWDQSWQKIVDRTEVGAGALSSPVLSTVTDPLQVSFAEVSTRYVKVHMWNDGTQGSPSYIELRSIKIFG